MVRRSNALSRDNCRAIRRGWDGKRSRGRTYPETQAREQMSRFPGRETDDSTLPNEADRQKSEFP